MVLDWGLNLGPPVLEASTVPLGYRGGSNDKVMFICLILQLTSLDQSPVMGLMVTSGIDGYVKVDA